MARWIDIAVGNRQLKLYDASTLLKTYPIAVGKVLTPTPTGNYIIVNKEANPGGPFGVLWNKRLIIKIMMGNKYC